MSDRPQKQLQLKMPTRHVYEDCEKPEPVFEEPTPLRYNRSLPHDIGQWKRNQKMYTASATINFDQDPLYSSELDHQAGPSLSPSSNPAFYPALRFHRRNSKSNPILEMAESNVSVQEKKQVGRSFSIVENSGDKKSTLAETVAKRGFMVAPLENIAGMDKNQSMPSSAEASPRHRLSPRLLADMFSGGASVFSNSVNKKVQMSDFDLSVIAPTSM